MNIKINLYLFYIHFYIMRVFTNKYFPLHNYKNIHNLLQQSISILKYDNKVYVPLIINHIDTKKLIINNKFIPESIINYETKFIYINNNYYDLIDKPNIRLYKINTSCSDIIKICKNASNGDILLEEDKQKFVGVI
jgi:hypothetical protein